MSVKEWSEDSHPREAVADVCSLTASVQRNASLPIVCKTAIPIPQMHPCLKYSSNLQRTAVKKEMWKGNHQPKQCLETSQAKSLECQHQKEGSETENLARSAALALLAQTEDLPRRHEEKTYAEKGRTSFILPACVPTRDVL